MVRRAVVLARGLGTRMQQPSPGVSLEAAAEALAARGLKALMPLKGRPFLDYLVASLLRAGLREVCLVIAPDADLVREHARRIGEDTGARVECAVQAEALGTADAVLAGERFAGGEPFIVCNGDDLYPEEALRRLAVLEDDACWLVAFSRDTLVQRGNISPERARDFAVVTASEAGDLLAIVEKPTDPELYVRDGKLWVSMNLYRFTPVIFGACRAVRPHPVRGELELTSAVADLLASGRAAFRVLFCEEPVLDLTSRADVQAAERLLCGPDARVDARPQDGCDAGVLR